MLYRIHLVGAGFKLTTLVVIGTVNITRYKLNFQDCKQSALCLSKRKGSQYTFNVLFLISFKTISVTYVIDRFYCEQKTI
jgi:hypothetical protein